MARLAFCGLCPSWRCAGPASAPTRWTAPQSAWNVAETGRYPGGVRGPNDDTLQGVSSPDLSRVPSVYVSSGLQTMQQNSNPSEPPSVAVHHSSSREGNAKNNIWSVIQAVLPLNGGGQAAFGAATLRVYYVCIILNNASTVVINVV